MPTLRKQLLKQWRHARRLPPERDNSAHDPDRTRLQPLPLYVISVAKLQSRTALSCQCVVPSRLRLFKLSMPCYRSLLLRLPKPRISLGDSVIATSAYQSFAYRRIWKLAHATATLLAGVFAVYIK